MKNRALLEISVDTLDAALAAVRGGADRIELCENLSVGGVSPCDTLMREARSKIRLPIFAMIRARSGDFCYSAAEFEQMKTQIELAKSAGMDGLVFGILRTGDTVDVERSAVLAQAAKPLPVTFHRAFDQLADLERGLRDVIATGATRILTSGGEATAEDGCAEIAKLVRLAGERVTILAGGTIRPENLSRIVRDTRAIEFHSGLSNLRPCLHRECSEFEAGVRELVRVLEEETRHLQTTPSAD